MVLPTPRIFDRPFPPGPYRPSNGTEGHMFEHEFCRKCIWDHMTHFGKDYDQGCEILARALVFQVDEPGYPTEWVFAADGFPVCTAFEPDGCT